MPDDQNNDDPSTTGNTVTAPEKEMTTSASGDSIVVTVTNTFQTEFWNVELPLDRPISHIMAKLISGLRQPTSESGVPIEYRLLWQEGERNLVPNENLRTAGVQKGHTLTLAREARAGALP